MDSMGFGCLRTYKFAGSYKKLSRGMKSRPLKEEYFDLYVRDIQKIVS